MSARLTTSDATIRTCRRHSPADDRENRRAAPECGPSGWTAENQTCEANLLRRALGLLLAAAAGLGRHLLELQLELGGLAGFDADVLAPLALAAQAGDDGVIADWNVAERELALVVALD